MRRPKQEAPNTTMFKTMATSLIIAPLITIAGALFLAFSKAPSGSPVSYYLSWSFPYGLAGLLMAVFGMYLLTSGVDQRDKYLFFSITALVMSAIIALSSIPILIMGLSMEIGISIIVIGVCCAGIAILNILGARNQ